MAESKRTLPAIDEPPADGVFRDWEEERKKEILSDPKKLDAEAIEGNKQATKVDVDDDEDNGLGEDDE